MNAQRKKKSVGRPPKFDEESNQITLTLPQRTLNLLRIIDDDRSRAIVKCVDAIAQKESEQKKYIKVVRMCDEKGLIVIGPCHSLAKIPGLRLVEIAPLRYLLAISENCSSHSLELAIMDLIDNLTQEENGDMELLVELRRQLSSHRRKNNITTAEILFVDI